MMVRALATIAVIALGGVLSACGGGGGTSDGGASHAGGPDKIKILLTHYPAGLYGLPEQVAIHQGYFKQNGIEVTKIFGSDGGGTSVRSVLAGDIAFADVATPGVVQAFNAGAPLKIVGGSVSQVADSFMVGRKGSPPVTSLQDLAGKTIAYTNPGGGTQTKEALLVKESGVPKSSVKLTAAGGDTEALTVLQKGAVDMTILADPAYSVDKNKYKTLFNLQKYIHGLQTTVIATSPKLIQSDPDLVRRYLKSIKQATDWLYAHPAQAGHIYAKDAGVKPSIGAQAITRVAAAKEWTLALPAAAMRNAITGGLAVGALDQEPIAWGDLVDQSFLPAGVERTDVHQFPTVKAPSD